MRRHVFFLYGVLSHLAFLITFLWMAAFVGALHASSSIDAPGAPFRFPAVGIDLLLIAVFAIQHSAMARPGWKRIWTRIVPPEIERSTYVAISSVLMALLMLLWQPIGPVLWDVADPSARAVLWGLFAAGWLMVPAVSLLIHHFDLFGTRQVWLQLRGRPYTQLPFATPGIYRYIRHPLYLGWMLAFWVTPTMSLGHLVFATAMTVYMLIAIPFEERDLVSHFGERYRRYADSVPRLIPRLARRRSRPQEVQA